MSEAIKQQQLLSAQRYVEFNAWWDREQVCSAHNMITRNAAFAAWNAVLEAMQASEPYAYDHVWSNGNRRVLSRSKDAHLSGKDDVEVISLYAAPVPAKQEAIPTWQERCEVHQDHRHGMISDQMLIDRMQEEIDDLRKALFCDGLPVGVKSL